MNIFRKMKGIQVAMFPAIKGTELLKYLKINTQLGKQYLHDAVVHIYINISINKD